MKKQKRAAKQRILQEKRRDRRIGYRWRVHSGPDGDIRILEHADGRPIQYRLFNRPTLPPVRKTQNEKRKLRKQQKRLYRVVLKGYFKTKVEANP